MGNLFLQEAFQELNILNEEDFNLGEIDSFKDAKEFNETEDEIDFTDVIDPEAETEDELKDSYIGDVILDCTVCHSKLYKNPEEVHFDEVEGLANTDEECPYCYSTDGYTIIGEVAPYGEDKEEEVEEVEEEETEDEEEIEESLKESYKMQRLTPDEIKQLKVGSIKYYNYNNSEDDYTDYSKVKVIKIGNRPIDGHIQVTIRDLQDGHDDQIVNADALANALYESLNEGISIQKGMTIKYDVDGNGTPDSCKIVDFKKGTNGQVAWVLLQPATGDPIRVSADSLVRSNEKPAQKEESLEESADISEYQKWVDYDMEKYGHISFNTFKKIKHAGFSVVKDQYGDYEVIADRKDEKLEKCDECSKKEIKEHFEKVEIETDIEKMEMTTEDNGKVVVTTEPKSEGEEVIEPVSVEIQDEINPKENIPVEDEAEVDISEFSEEDFNNLGESYLKKVYENVNSFKTSSIKTAKNKLVIEGVIGFASGKNKKTSFVFESKDMDKRGRLRFIGENLQLSRGKKSFTLTGSLDNGKFIAESLNYNYRQKDSNGNSTRVYGTVRK